MSPDNIVSLSHNYVVLNSYGILVTVCHSNLEHVLVEKKIPKRYDNKFIEYDLLWVDFHENKNKSSRRFSAI